MMEKKGIMVAGSVLVDKINTISAYPGIGELTQIQSIVPSVGGCVPNVALDLKKISPELTVWAAGCIGGDAEGEFVTGILRDGGVNTEHFVICDEKTSFTDVMSVAGGQRTFFTYPGASAGFGFSHVPFDCNPKILHLGYFLLLKAVDEGEGLKILQEATKRGIETSIDLVSENSDRYRLVVPCLPYTDYLIINEMEAGRLTGMNPCRENLTAMGEKLLSMGVRKMVILHMPEEAVCCTREGVTRMGTYILPEGYIQGTTGAGDAFCAGALTAIYEKSSPEDILSFANSCAMMSLRASDATGGLATKAEICKFTEKYSRREL